jgi:hypothetical protein
MITPESTSCSELRVALWKKWLASTKIFQLYVDQLETVRKVRVLCVRIPLTQCFRHSPNLHGEDLELNLED